MTVIRQFAFAILFASLFAINSFGVFSQTEFDVHNIYQSLDGAASKQQGETISLVNPWWDPHVIESQRREHTPVAADIHTLIYLAVKHSNQIRIAKEEPIIVETGITEADSAFDWNRYVNSNWFDTSEPVSTTLAAGGSQSRLNDHRLQLLGGLSKLNRFGGNFDINQSFGWQNNNSTFFVPEDQATSQLTLAYTHPLLRGRGQAYNTSLELLAKIDSEIAEKQFIGVLQDHLLEVVRAYWALYLERAALAQQVRLYLNTERIVAALKSRQTIDAQRTQWITASSALESRRADLIRARTAVVNSETRLRGLINAPELSRSDIAELIPVERPSVEYYPAELDGEIQTAIRNRPEVRIAVQDVKAATTRLGIAEHELLPVLNLVTQAYVNGLQGNNDFAGAFANQFSDGAPSYSIGFEYELPVGNRLAKARRTRRCVEARQVQARYEQTLATIQTEVDIAVRELNTSYREIQATSRALTAAEAEAQTIEVRWTRFIDGNANGGLNLESLLRAQERVTEAERTYVNTLLIYNLAMINLKRATGTLLVSENLVINRDCKDNCGPSIEIEKLGPGGSRLPAVSQNQFGEQIEPVGAINAPAPGQSAAPNAQSESLGDALGAMMKEVNRNNSVDPATSALGTKASYWANSKKHR